MKIDVTKTYFLGFLYINGPYSFMNDKGEKVEGISDKYILHFAFPAEAINDNTKDYDGLMSFTFDVKKDKIEDIIQGGASALIDHVGQPCEIHRNMSNGRIKFIKWTDSK